MGTVIQISRSKGGMPKLAVEGEVKIGPGGVEQDWQRNRKVHGGPKKAVLMLAAEVVEELAERGFPVYPGALGENLTVRGLDWKLWKAGQRYLIGDEVEIELTTLRQPCANLNVYGAAIKAELLREARGGFYARVLRAGVVAVGDAVRPVDKLVS
jgi:MOSC domain-containing protein YiiM